MVTPTFLKVYFIFLIWEKIMNDLYLNFQDAYMDNGKEFLVSSNLCNGLFCVKENENRYIGSFYNKHIDIQYLHKAIYLDKNDLLFIPTYGNEIDLYNVFTKEFGVIIPKYKINDLTTVNIILDRKILFIPRTLGVDLCIFDIIDRTFERHSWWGTVTSALGIKYTDASLFYCTEYSGNIYLPLRGYNVILEVDLNNREIIEHVINIDNAMPYSIDFYENKAWITQENSKTIICWDCINGSFTEFENNCENIEENYIPYIKTVFLNNKAIFIPRNHSIFLIIDLISGETSSIDINKKNVNVNKNMNSTVWFYGYQIIKDKLILFPSNTDKILILDVKNKNIEWKKTGSISKNELLEYQLCNRNAEILYESEIINCKEWIFGIMKMD